jgi:hypothetical protein
VNLAAGTGTTDDHGSGRLPQPSPTVEPAHDIADWNGRSPSVGVNAGRLQH